MWNDEDNNPYGTSFARSEEAPSSPESPQRMLPPPAFPARLVEEYRRCLGDADLL